MYLEPQRPSPSLYTYTHILHQEFSITTQLNICCSLSTWGVLFGMDRWGRDAVCCVLPANKLLMEFSANYGRRRESFRGPVELKSSSAALTLQMYAHMAFRGALDKYIHQMPTVMCLASVGPGSESRSRLYYRYHPSTSVYKLRIRS